MQKKHTFQITPQTHVRSTQGDRIYFRIPRDKLRPAGLKRLLRLERYNQYKIDLSALAKSIRFTPPEQGGHLVFYIPVPKTWKKYKKEQYHLQLHQSTPDWDNLSKAFFDSLLSEDKHIADIWVTKVWVNQEKGWIEFNTSLPTVASPDNLM
jgi:Holliday junction resolvase RusA-like endonuclease